MYHSRAIAPFAGGGGVCDAEPVPRDVERRRERLERVGSREHLGAPWGGR